MTDISLRELREIGAGLSVEECCHIAEQGLRLLETVYVHRDDDPASRFTRAVERLRNLKRRDIARLAERQFHDQLIAIFKSLRDRHTHYILPQPFQSFVPSLPLVVRDVFADGRRRYVVTGVEDGAGGGGLAAGAIVTHWNDIPIERAIASLADGEDGAHPSARHARAVAALTARPAWLLPLPHEDVVTLRYLDGDREGEARFEWRVQSLSSPPGPLSLTTATDSLMEVLQQLEIERFPRELAKAEAQLRAMLPEEVGFVRLTRFYIEPEHFVPQFVALLERQPAGGLILDLRGNPGGIIQSGELLLQLFTPRRIEPSLWQFRATPETLQLCRFVSDNADFPRSARGIFAAYIPSIEAALASGGDVSAALPTTLAEEANGIGRRYAAPVLLVTDALTYSVGDVFAAGFQDHRIGEILGTDEATGAGGSNDIAYEIFSTASPQAFPPLPRGASFRVSARRCFRVHDNAGTLIEGLGVRPDHRHDLTRRDRLEGDGDLLDRAHLLLAHGRSRPMPDPSEAGEAGSERG